MNMTTLNFALTRAAGRDFAPGDEILTTALDHDGGVAPWVELAADKGLTVRRRRRDRRPDGRLRRPRAEALGPDARRRVRARLERDRLARRRAADLPARPRGRGALVDRRGALRRPRAVDVAELGCDVLLCSPYKFCGPHLGMAYVRERLAETWRAYKARPSPSAPVGRRFETGTLPYELLAGFQATIAYLDSLGGMDVLRDYERALGERFLAGLPGRRRPLRPAGDGRPRADVPAQRRRRSGGDGCTQARRARHRRLVRRQLVLRRARRPPARAVAPRRA